MSSRAVDSRSMLFAVAVAFLLIILWALRSIVILVALSVLLAVVLDPLVSALQRIPLGRTRISRGIASGIVVLALVVVAGWALSIGVPATVNELAKLAQSLPGTYASLLTEAEQFAARNNLGEYVDPVVDNLRASTQDTFRAATNTALRWAAGMVGNLGALARLALLPILTFYLLAESDAVRDSAQNFLPRSWRDSVQRVQHAVNRALRSYVQGQTIVCLIMGIAVGTSLWLAGFPAAAVLGILVGLAEIIPFLGFWMAMLAIVLTGYSVSPSLALTGFVIYSAINLTNGYLILPRVMGRHLKMHPFVVMVSVLSGATLLGPIGVFIALPGAAVVQAIIEEFAGRGREDEPETEGA